MTTGSTCENEGDFHKFTSKRMLRCKEGERLTIGVVCKSLTSNKNYYGRGGQGE